MTWDYRSVAMLLERISQESLRDISNFHNLGLQECRYDTRWGYPRKSQGHPRTSMTWDYRSVAMLLEGISQEVQGTFQDLSNLGLQGMPMLPEILEEVHAGTSKNYSHLGLQNVAMLADRTF